MQEGKKIRRARAGSSFKEEKRVTSSKRKKKKKKNRAGMGGSIVRQDREDFKPKENPKLSMRKRPRPEIYKKGNRRPHSRRGLSGYVTQGRDKARMSEMKRSDKRCTKTATSDKGGTERSPSWVSDAGYGRKEEPKTVLE